MRLEGARPPEGTEAPDFPQELFLRENPVRLRGEARDELELLSRERDHRVAHPDPSRTAVDDQVAGDEHLGGRRRAPPQKRPDPSEQLLVRKRAADDVVRATVERTHALDGIGRRREQDDRNVPVPRPPGLAPAEPKAEVELGEENEIRPDALDELVPAVA